MAAAPVRGAVPPILKAAPEGLVVVVLLAAAAALVEAPLVVPVEPPQAAKLSIMPAASTKLITFLFMIVFSPSYKNFYTKKRL